MANEFVHATVGVQLAQAEFEAVGLHICNSQATGDLIYASSASQLSRLGIGSTNAVLQVVGGVPAWVTNPTIASPTFTGTVTLPSTVTVGAVVLTFPGATGTFATLAGTEELDNKTLDSSVAKGTWTASGTWTIPAVTISSKITTYGGTVLGYLGNRFYTYFTSDAADNFAHANHFDGQLTGAAADTNKLIGSYFGNSIVTQTAAETISVIAQMLLIEPCITKNVTTITIASTLYIASAPTEGATNAAIYVASGDTNLASLTMRGNIYYGANQVVGARVVDARIDDIPNSGDATTDGIIDAIQDALIAHGLVAAA